MEKTLKPIFFPEFPVFLKYIKRCTHTYTHKYTHTKKNTRKRIESERERKRKTKPFHNTTQFLVYSPTTLIKPNCFLTGFVFTWHMYTPWSFLVSLVTDSTHA